MIKKISAIILVLVLCLSVMVVPVSAAEITLKDYGFASDYELAEGQIAAIKVETDKEYVSAGDVVTVYVDLHLAEGYQLTTSFLTIGINSAIFPATSNKAADIKASAVGSANHDLLYKPANGLTWANLIDTNSNNKKIEAANTADENALYDYYIRVSLARNSEGNYDNVTGMDAADVNGEDGAWIAFQLTVAEDLAKGTKVNIGIPSGAIASGQAYVGTMANAGVDNAVAKPTLAQTNLTEATASAVVGTAPCATSCTPEQDDGDCTTAVNCTVCGHPVIPAVAHTYEDDGDCTTAVNCTVCGKEVTPAAAAHSPAEDDGDCTTAVNCTVCGKEVVAAKDAHTYEDDKDCTTAAYCTVCGKEVVAAKEHVPAEDDNDCETPNYCTVCGKETTAAGGHTPAEDDGDCTTAVNCTVCGKEVTPAAKEHTPAQDDGDCTTAVNCTVCGTEVTPAAAEHTYEDDGDCTTAVNCTVCGKEVTPAAKEHTPAEDDGDCTTAVNCTVCGTEVTPAAKEHTPEQDDGDCTTAVNCTVCGTEVTPAAAEHTYEDDGDCTTAVNCTVCGKEVTPAAAAHSPAEDDGDCTTAVNCTVCGTEVTPAAAEHTPGQIVIENEVEATCGEAGSYDEVVYCTECGTEISRDTITVDATGEHEYDDGVVTEPTYTSQGYTTYTCTVCGDSYDDDFVDALEPEFTFAIREPSITTIRCKDTIVLHAEVNGELPEGATIVWEADNENFSTEELEDGKLEITSQNKGDTVFTATIYDAEGNVLGTDSVEMYSKAGFFGKIGGFFRSLFGSTLYYNY